MAKILIIDTDESVVSDIKNLISDTSQNTVDFCNSVNGSLGYLESNEPDIIITDIFPPKPECTKIIDYCAINHPNAKIILTSIRRKCPTLIGVNNSVYNIVNTKAGKN